LQVGPLRPRDLKPIAPNAGRILLRNVYGWFDRVEPGLYRLAEGGATALHRWAESGDTPGIPARSHEDATHVRSRQSADSAGSSVP
jgi:hypothetical protein